MLEVKVTLEIPGVPEALDRLADAIASQNCGCKPGKAMDAINERLTAAMNAAETAAPAQIPVQPAPAQTAIAPTPAPAPVQAAAPAPAPAAPVAPVQTPAVQPMPAPTPMPAAPAAKKYTRDEIAKAGSVLASQGKIPELLALLNKYGVQSVVQLSPDKYDAFAGDLRALGAAL